MHCIHCKLDLQCLLLGLLSHLAMEREFYLQWPNPIWILKPKPALSLYPNPIEVNRNPLSKETFSLAFQPKLLLQQAHFTCLLFAQSHLDLGCMLQSPAWRAQVLLFSLQ